LKEKLNLLKQAHPQPNEISIVAFQGVGFLEKLAAKALVQCGKLRIVKEPDKESL